MRFKMFVVLALAALLTLGAAAQDEGAPLKIGVLSDQSGALALYARRTGNGT